jgi:E3 ubiquitin-protein ligase TRIP12
LINKNLSFLTRSSICGKTAVPPEDSRLVYLKKNPTVYAEFVSSLFAILYAVYSSSAGPAIKHRCLRSLLRMIYYLPHEPSHTTSQPPDKDNSKGPESRDR